MQFQGKGENKVAAAAELLDAFRTSPRLGDIKELLGEFVYEEAMDDPAAEDVPQPRLETRESEPEDDMAGLYGY